MKVLQINTTANTTSTGRIAEEIGQKLQEHNHESVIACRKVGPAGSTSSLIQFGNKWDTYMHGLKTRLTDRHGFGSKRATQRLLKEIERIDPDAVGLHNLHGYYINIELLFTFLKKVQKPVIWTLHDCWPFTGHCSFFDYVSCEKWKTECYDCPLSDKYPASWLWDNSRQNFHKKRELFTDIKNLEIVTPSRWLADLVSQSFLSEYPVSVIHNGIDLERFKPVFPGGVSSKYNLEGHKVLLGVASVWDRRKGLSDFIALSKQLDKHYKIILIGLSETEITDLPDNVIGIKRTENIDQLVAFYSAADVFVNPTLVDNFPTTNIEALACGTPVVTYNTGGSPEAIDENTGIVVPRGDIKKLASAIRKVAQQDRSQYQSNCRNRAAKYFNKDDRYQDYLNLYNELVPNFDTPYYAETN